LGCRREGETDARIKNGKVIKKVRGGREEILFKIQVNSTGLLSKIDVLREYAQNTNLDVIGMVETFLNSKVLPAEVYINGYKS
jgi:hypothetical protein